MMNQRSLRERGFATWPEDAAYGGTQNAEALNQRIYMQYLGVLALLGRIAGRARVSNDERGLIEQAFVDANVVLRHKGSEMYFERCSGGGYSTFFREPVDGGHGSPPTSAQ